MSAITSRVLKLLGRWNAPKTGHDPAGAGPAVVGSAETDSAAHQWEPSDDDEPTVQSVTSAEELLEEIGLTEELPITHVPGDGPLPKASDDPTSDGGDRSAGWRDDPDGNADTLRYWDGSTWTDHYAKKQT